MELCKSESIKELATALSKAQALMEGAKKDANNPYYKSKYANLEAVWECARKPLTDNGLAVVQMPGKSELGHFLETTLMHSSGEFISGRMFIAPIKEDPQGIGSAITYARRYSLMSTLGIAPEDDDGEAAMGRTHAGNHAAPEIPPKGQPLPGSKESKSFDDWRTVVWHVPFGAKKDKTFDYKGHTLAEINLNDPEGLAYWVRTYAPKNKKNMEDVNLRLALDKAGEALAEKEPEPPADEPEQVPAEDLPKHDTTASEPAEGSLLGELQVLCAKNKVPPDLILQFAKAKGLVPKKAKFLSDAPDEVLQKAINSFAFFIKEARKQEEAA